MPDSKVSRFVKPVSDNLLELFGYLNNAVVIGYDRAVNPFADLKVIGQDYLDKNANNASKPGARLWVFYCQVQCMLYDNYMMVAKKEDRSQKLAEQRAKIKQFFIQLDTLDDDSLQVLFTEKAGVNTLFYSLMSISLDCSIEADRRIIATIETHFKRFHPDDAAAEPYLAALEMLLYPLDKARDANFIMLKSIQSIRMGSYLGQSDDVNGHFRLPAAYDQSLLIFVRCFQVYVYLPWMLIDYSKNSQAVDLSQIIKCFLPDVLITQNKRENFMRVAVTLAGYLTGYQRYFAHSPAHSALIQEGYNALVKQLFLQLYLASQENPKLVLGSSFTNILGPFLLNYVKQIPENPDALPIELTALDFWKLFTLCMNQTLFNDARAQHLQEHFPVIVKSMLDLRLYTEVIDIAEPLLQLIRVANHYFFIQQLVCYVNLLANLQALDQFSDQWKALEEFKKGLLRRELEFPTNHISDPRLFVYLSEKLESILMSTEPRKDPARQFSATEADFYKKLGFLVKFLGQFNKQSKLAEQMERLEILNVNQKPTKTAVEYKTKVKRLVPSGQDFLIPRPAPIKLQPEAAAAPAAEKKPAAGKKKAQKPIEEKTKKTSTRKKKKARAKKRAAMELAEQPSVSTDSPVEPPQQMPEPSPPVLVYDAGFSPLEDGTRTQITVSALSIFAQLRIELPEPVHQFLSKLKRITGQRIFLSGGAVADLYFNRVPNDYDLYVSDITLAELERVFSQLNIPYRTIININPIITINYAGVDYDIKVIQSNGNLKQELRQRVEACDFLVSALIVEIMQDRKLSVHNDRALLSLKEKRISACREDIDLFAEDPLRVFRLIKMMVKYPELCLDQSLKQKLKQISQNWLLYLESFYQINPGSHAGKIRTSLSGLFASVPMDVLIPVLEEYQFFESLFGLPKTNYAIGLSVFAEHIHPPEQRFIDLLSLMQIQKYCLDSSPCPLRAYLYTSEDEKNYFEQWFRYIESQRANNWNNPVDPRLLQLRGPEVRDPAAYSMQT